MPMLPAAIGIVLDQTEKKILLVKRKDVPVWVLPGGGIEIGEKPFDAVLREIWEETNLKVKVMRQVAEYTPINRLATLTFVFICKLREGTPQLSNETSDIAFFSIDALPSSLFNPHRDWINEGLKTKSLVKKPLTQITYWATFKYFFQHPLFLLKYAWTRWVKNRHERN
ncbi:NUDIX hydrolase [Candidatus Protochlamydia amoebophila]|nr:NUDIX domain-containing protein [Candidatus Protochlamydia amoebophila]